MSIYGEWRRRHGKKNTGSEEGGHLTRHTVLFFCRFNTLRNIAKSTDTCLQVVSSNGLSSPEMTRACARDRVATARKLFVFRARRHVSTSLFAFGVPQHHKHRHHNPHPSSPPSFQSPLHTTTDHQKKEQHRSERFGATSELSQWHLSDTSS